jgi:two-component system response regulator (stage 0 sporulation protein F)
MSLVSEIKAVSIMEKCVIIKNTMEQKPKLLVVDDERDQCDSIKSYFSRRNFLVFTAATGEGALALIKENKPDLVLLDMKLEGNMDGKDVLQILRQSDKETKVVLVTGDILSEHQMQEITDLGIVEFLHKPVDMQTLEGIIKKVLQENYPTAIRFEAIKPKEESIEVSLKRINHELANITNDIVSKCELYLLDTEEGLNKDKSEKARLDEAIDILKSVLKQTERLTDVVKKLSSLAKKEL